MGNPLVKIGEWLVKAMTDKLLEPINELRKDVSDLTEAQEALTKLVETKHADDPAALECDLAVLDERICYLVSKCLEKGYTTELDRRIVSRLHEAYQSRGGNHGEDKVYEKFCALPTEEEWRRQHEVDPS